MTPTSKPRQRYWHSSIAECCHAAPSSEGWTIVDATLSDIASVHLSAHWLGGRRACFGLQRCGFFVAGGSDVALGGDHGFVAEERNQGVDTDLGVGELGGKRAAQPVKTTRLNTIHLGAF